MGGEGELDRHCCCNGIAGASKGHKEGIPLRVDLVAIELKERGT